MPEVNTILKTEVAAILLGISAAGKYNSPEWHEALAAVALAIGQTKAAETLYRVADATQDPR